MKTYLIGSDPQADICLSCDDNSIAAIHLALFADPKGGYQIVDRSETGTFLWHDGHWLKINQAHIDLDDKITLGTFAINVRDLFAKHPALTTFENQNDYYNILKNAYQQERDPQTGEIIHY